MNLSTDLSPLLTRRDAVHLRTFSLWIVAYALTLMASTFVIESRLLRPDALTWFFPVVALLVGAFTVRAYVIFLRQADELLRKILLEGLAWGMGAAVIFMPVYRLCERLGAPRLDSVDPLLVILVAWAIGHVRGVRRFSSTEGSL